MELEEQRARLGIPTKYPFAAWSMARDIQRLNEMREQAEMCQRMMIKVEAE
jgi:hypothetical protein